MRLTPEERVPGNKSARVDRNCKKWRSFSDSLGVIEYRTYNKKKEATWISHILHRNWSYWRQEKKKSGSKGSRGRKRKQLLDDLKEMGGYNKLKRGSTKSHSVENSLWKRLWTYHNTDYEMNEWMKSLFFLQIVRNPCVNFLGKLHSFSILQQLVEDASWLRAVAANLSLPSPFSIPNAVRFVMDEVVVGEFMFEC